MLLLYNESGNVDSFGTKRLERMAIDMEVSIMKHMLSDQPYNEDIISLDNESENEILLNLYDSLGTIRRSKDDTTKLSNINNMIEQLCNYRMIIKNKLHKSNNQEDHGNESSFEETNFLSKNCTNTLKFQSYVSSISFSSDGNLLAVGSKGFIQIYNTSNYELIGNLHINEKDAYIRSLCFTKDSKNLMSGGEDCEVKIWNVDTMKQETSLIGKSGEIYSLTISNDESILISGTSDGNIDIWDLKNRQLIKNLNVNDIITSIIILEDQKHFVLSSLKGTVYVFEIESGKIIHSFNVNNEIHTLAFNIQSNELVVGCANSKIEVLEFDDEKKLSSKGTLMGHNNLISSLCYTKHNNILISGSRDKQLKFWFKNYTQKSKTLFENTILSIDSSPKSDENHEIVAVGCGTNVLIYSLTMKINN